MNTLLFSRVMLIYSYECYRSILNSYLFTKLINLFWIRKMQDYVYRNPRYNQLNFSHAMVIAAY